MQSFRPNAAHLERHGYSLAANAPASADLVLFLPTKQKLESLYWMARSAAVLRPGGHLVVAAEVQLGAKSYRKELFSLLGEGDSWSKDHCVVSSAVKNESSFNQSYVTELLTQGGIRPIEGTSYKTQVGLYGWDKIDQGSRLLITHLPAADLHGNGADFGCGYGYLAVEALKKAPAISAMSMIDAESLALEACRLNIEAISPKARCSYLWSDISASSFEQQYDFILMNPPHHNDRLQDFELGRRFIAQAHAALKPGGVLNLVVNDFLPYEEVLQKHFAAFQLLANESGFKVLRAVA